MLKVKNMKYEQRNDPVVDNNVYDAKIVSFKEFTFKDRQGQDVQKIIVIAEITEDGFKGIQVPGYVFANFRPSTRSTVNLRRWCEALGAQFPSQEQEEWSFDLDTLIGAPCKIKTEKYMGFDKRNNVQVTKCKIMDIMPIHKKAPVAAQQLVAPANPATTLQSPFASAVAQTAQAQDIAMQRAYAQTVGVVSSPTMTVPTPVQPVIPAQQVVPQVANQPVFAQVATQVPVATPVQQAVPQPVMQPVQQVAPQVVPTVNNQQSSQQQPAQQCTPSVSGSEEVSPW